MATRSPWAAMLLCLSVGGLAAAPAPDRTADGSPPAVEVAYDHPERFTDVGNGRHGSEKARAGDLAELRDHIVRQAGRRLPAGQRLAVTISDVDLAGDVEPWRAGLAEVRIVKDIYPPRIDLRFALLATDGSLIKDGERKLRNPAFQWMGAPYGSDRLRYEKAMIDRWLDDELPRRKG